MKKKTLLNSQPFLMIIALLEFEHSLVAYLDGHKIEAGLDASSYSYIMFDGALLARKARII